MKNLVLSLVFIVTALLAGCSSSGKHLTSIQVTPATPSVAAGLTQQFKATGTYSDNSTQDLTTTAAWTSLNTSVATIAAGGLAATKAAGSATITATQSGITGTAALTVTAPNLVSIAVTPANATIPVGVLRQFTATGTFTDGSTQDLTTTATWSSTTSSVASIAAGGLATARTIGNTTITATSGSISGNTALTVAVASLVSVQIPDGDVTIANNTSHQFSAIGIYNDGSLRALTALVTWSSTQTGVVTLSTLGRARAVSPGSTTITATLNSISASVTLNVTNATATTITVSPSTRTIEPLTRQVFTAIGTFSDSSTQIINQDVTWASSATGVATISNTSGSIGAATGVSAGTTNISAALEGVTGSVPLNVSSATLTSITLTPSTAVMALGSTLALHATGNFSDGTHQSIDTVVAWTSSATNVATVNSIGLVTGVANGPVSITAQLGGVGRTANLTVEDLTAVTIAPASASFAADTSTTRFTAVGTLADSSTQDLTGSVLWTSSNPSSVTISIVSGSKGVAVGLAAGTSIITAELSGLVGTAQLTVTNATLSSITITPANPNIALGASQQFIATGTFSDSTTQNLSAQVGWSSSDINVALVDSFGSASTAGTGTTTISAALHGVTGTTVLTVH
jgi:uncharacterized protein YjdB